MSQTFIFYDQAGTIPGIPGTFAHCRVDIDDEGNVTTSPLVIVQAVEEAQPIEPITVVQEQEQAPVEERKPAPDTNTNGG